MYPNDGDYVSTKPVIRFGLIGMGVAPAGIDKANTGHHHLMVDEKLPPFDEPIPTDFNHLHFGAGQTEAQITLPPGRHTLQLLLGDENHVAHDPPVYSKQITVMVTEIRPPGRGMPAAGRVPKCARRSTASGGSTMSKFLPAWVVFLCGIFFVVVSTDAAWAERKVALVVGNTQYKNAEPGTIQSEK